MIRSLPVTSSCPALALVVPPMVNPLSTSAFAPPDGASFTVPPFVSLRVFSRAASTRGRWTLAGYRRELDRVAVAGDSAVAHPIGGVRPVRIARASVPDKRRQQNTPLERL